MMVTFSSEPMFSGEQGANTGKLSRKNLIWNQKHGCESVGFASFVLSSSWVAPMQFPPDLDKGLNHPRLRWVLRGAHELSLLVERLVLLDERRIWRVLRRFAYFAKFLRIEWRPRCRLPRHGSCCEVHAPAVPHDGKCNMTFAVCSPSYPKSRSILDVQRVGINGFLASNPFESGKQPAIVAFVCLKCEAALFPALVPSDPYEMLF